MSICAEPNFNPRTPVGCDRKHWRELKVEMAFQSTHPSGVRRRRNGETENHTKGFNPRTPVGCDAKRLAYIQRMSLFQSTHPSGVRPSHVTLLHLPIRVSIHAPQWGATSYPPYFGPTGLVSIHAPQWGATARMGIAFHNMEAPPVLKTDFIAKIHVHRSIHKFSNQKHQQTIHF